MSELATRMENNAPVPGNGRTVTDLVRASIDQIEMAVGNRVGAERLARILLTQIRVTPKLAACTPNSFMGAAMLCAQLRLDPGAPNGHCWLVPMNNKRNGQKTLEVEWWLGYRGMVELAHRSDRLASITAQSVHEADEFDADPIGSIHHKIDYRTPPSERGDVVLYYAHARTTTGGESFVVMHPEEINTIRDASPSARAATSPWKSHYDAMARKTCIRQLNRWLPAGTDTATAETHDQAVNVWDREYADLGPRPAETDPAALTETTTTDEGDNNDGE